MDVEEGQQVESTSAHVSHAEDLQQIPMTPRSSTQKTTRQSCLIFGLGSKITAEDSEIKGARLPTSEQVLRCIRYHLTDGGTRRENRTRWESAKLVLAKIVVFYQKANIPMISDRKACEKMIKLLDDNDKIRAIPLERRSTAATVKKVSDMEEKLAKTFQLWPQNADILIKNPDDLSILQSMKGDRSATFGSHDNALASKLKRSQKRSELEALRRDKVNEQSSVSEVAELIDSDSSDDADSASEHSPNNASSSAATARRHRRTRTGTAAFIPHDIIQRPALVALATRLQMTPTQQSAYTEALISEAGGHVSKVSTSYSTTDKSRRCVGQKIASAVREQWVVPKLATLHWDSKQMPSLSNNNVVEERLAVLVGNGNEMKFLGVPSYPAGSDRKAGDIIADLTVDLLRSWNCSDSIVNMAFDTTASNTGHVTAACVAIQMRLGRALLWSGCRHHIGEVILTHVFESLEIEVSKSPDMTLFTRFRKNFERLETHRSATERLSRFDDTEFDENAKPFVDKCREHVLQIAGSESSFRRDDYKEFAELCLVFLDGEAGEHKVTFKRPGALHKARWMAKLIYSIKICLFEQQIADFPRSTITTQQQVTKVRDFVNFVTLVYSSWWMTCSSVIDAPWNDLKLFHSFLQYKLLNADISATAVRAFTRHLWYLTAEMVPLALWSKNVPDTDRRALADRLLAVKPAADLKSPQDRYGSGFGKPKFPESITATTTLTDLVGSDSWYIFDILQLDSTFLNKDVSDWASSDEYLAAITNIESLNAINDGAERGVKLSSDFLSASKSEGHYQDVLQVVEQDRHRQPNLRKCKPTSE